ncbi:Mediator of RNA polymerase II transcription subunit 20a [Hibiscus syriacus]|uniref:Mediator of RNA polymerase II transcription subunit 20 n=1 Tax=Hibiscus syriacus TaxID=106335 RepID=A0A6A3CTE6_HIBSY|nr:uncharacterized protein LOC120146130 [Hibiscus syriacus]KAE8731827.1 Mediator of RNA polymerase II transcription subunit 20a [Hibiscus syriacus]
MNGVKEGHWKSTPTFYKLMLRDQALATEFPREFIGISLLEKPNKHYFILPANKIVLEADSSIQLIMEKLQSYKSRVALNFEYRSMSVSGIHGHILEVTVVGCNKLKDTEWISRRDPHVCVEYGSTKCRTRTCTDGGKAPIFQERFTFTLSEGLREINVVAFDDAAWPLQTKTGRNLGTNCC